MAKIAAYGTLRKGDYNYERFKEGMKYIGTATAHGFDMYNLGFYPMVVKGEGKITVDVFEVDPQYLNLIDRMEFGAGYDKELIEVDIEGETHVCGIYTFSRITGKKIESGDWFDKTN